MTSPTMADYDLFYMGGIAGKVAGAFTLKNCINRGNLGGRRARHRGYRRSR